MNTRPFRLWMGVALLLGSLGCGSLGVTPTDTPLPPTKTAPPTATQAPPTATQSPPTQTPLPIDTATLAPEDLLPLSPGAYEHPSGAFTIGLPEGWTVNDYATSMSGAPSEGYLFMNARFENVGVEFDNAMMSTYVTAFGANWWGFFAKDYNPNAPEVLDDGSWVVAAYVVGENDTPMVLVSYYWPVGSIIFAADFGCPYDQYDAYAPAFGALAASLRVNTDAAADAPLYQYRRIFNGPKDLFQLEFPAAWAYTHTESSDGHTLADTFTSPDGNSAIISIGYDDGTIISKSVAGQFALGLLHDVFEIQNIKVTDDQVQSDGSERLNWTSPGLNGITFFETRGTTFLMLNWIVNEGYYDLFFPLWDEILGTYTVPQ